MYEKKSNIAIENRRKADILKGVIQSRNYLIWIVVPLLRQYKLSESGSHLTSKMWDGTVLI
jgi:hypothetical protein